MKELKVIPADQEFGVSPETTCFAITSSASKTGKPFIMGGVSKKINGWHWHALGRSSNKQFDSFELAAKAAQKALGPNIQFEEKI